MKKVNVKFYVWSDIEIEVEVKDILDKEKILATAINKAIEEQPKVAWQYDDMNEYKIEEIA